MLQLVSLSAHEQIAEFVSTAHLLLLNLGVGPRPDCPVTPLGALRGLVTPTLENGQKEPSYYRVLV